MIAQFPTFYPDELVFSLLSRYFVRSGYIAYTFAAEEILKSKTIKPDIEFVNEYTKEAYFFLTMDKPLEYIVNYHTMFPYYARFLPTERREKAFRSLMNLEGNYYNLLPIPKAKEGHNRFLRYCPECVKEDRKKYGETYWHRKHQIIGCKVCPIHGCELIETNLNMTRKKTNMFVAAELVIPLQLQDTVYSDNPIEIELAKYVYQVFKAPIDRLNQAPVNKFIQYKMENTPYKSLRGEQVNVSRLHTDFCSYYQGLRDNWFTEYWQMQKVLSNDRWNMYEICMIAMFLSVPINELIQMELPEKTQQELFDERIYELHEQGLKYTKIAEILNASYHTVKMIGERKYGKGTAAPRANRKGGVKAKDWKQMDIDTLPLVKDAIKNIKGIGDNRPKKVTVFAVQKYMKLPDKCFDNLPMCKAEILKHKETQEEYWAREVVWSYQMLIKHGEPVNWKHIRDMINIKKVDFLACLPEIQQIVDEEVYKSVHSLV